MTTLTIAEYAAANGLHENTVRTWIRSGARVFSDGAKVVRCNPETMLKARWAIVTCSDSSSGTDSAQRQDGAAGPDAQGALPAVGDGRPADCKSAVSGHPRFDSEAQAPQLPRGVDRGLSGSADRMTPAGSADAGIPSPVDTHERAGATPALGTTGRSVD